MKKLFFVATSLAVLSTGAYASKARMAALQNSFLIDDTTKVLTNPADLNNMKNYVITEWGRDANTSTQSHAEGGFFKDAGRFAYGLYLGNEPDNAFNDERDGANTNFLKRDNPVDLFFSGDMGIQWGVRFGYASSTDEAFTVGSTTIERNQNYYGLGVGLNWKDLTLYGNADLKDNSEGSTVKGDKYEGALNPSLVAEYSFMGFDFHGAYSDYGYEMTYNTDQKLKKDTVSWELGVGKTHEVAKTARLFTELLFNKDNTSAEGQKTKSHAFKALLGYEADATSWLVLRGSLSQNIVGAQYNNAGKKKTTENTTVVAAGATLNFGQLKVDGMIGTDGNHASDTQTNGNLRLDNLMTNVAVHYWF